MRPGTRLGIDLGTVRIGVATCDPAGLIATPLETVPRGRGDMSRISGLVTERDAIEVVMGLPTSLSGRAGPAARAVEEYAAALAASLEVPVRLVDERFSTTVAQRDMRASGVDTRRGRSVVDQAAAGEEDRERRSRRNYYRFIDLWGKRKDLLTR